MKKLLQNKVAESKLTMPITALYAIGVWLLMGLGTGQWWTQFACFAVTTYLMVELNNQNALIRIYSRMVSSAFLGFMCAACFLLPSLRGAFMQMCVVGTYIMLFHSYQDKQATGHTYYGFALFGLASLAYAQTLCFVPIIWLLMATNLLSLSWRTWGASLLGLLTPYWFWCCWLVYQEDFTPLASHFLSLGDIQIPINYARVGMGFMLTLGLLIISTVTGIVHYLRKSYNDSIRIRLLFGFFIWMDLAAILLICLQPQLNDLLLRLIIVNTAPLVAHFLALTSTRATNAAFVTLTLLLLLLTAYNLWTSSYLF